MGPDHGDGSSTRSVGAARALARRLEAREAGAGRQRRFLALLSRRPARSLRRGCSPCLAAGRAPAQAAAWLRNRCAALACQHTSSQSPQPTSIRTPPLPQTPMGADSGAHSSGEPCSSSQQQSTSHTHQRTLSVHWAEALEQHSQRPHTPLHALCAPDKPCLKAQQTSFPFLEEVGAGSCGCLRAARNGRCAAECPHCWVRGAGCLRRCAAQCGGCSPAMCAMCALARRGADASPTPGPSNHSVPCCRQRSWKASCGARAPC